MYTVQGSDISSAISQKGESQIRCYKKTKYAKFSEKGTFLTPSHAHERVRIQGVRNVRFSENMWCFVFLLFPFWDLPFCLITDELCFCEQIFLTSRFLFLNKVLLFCNLTLRAPIQQVTFALTIQDMVYTKKPLQTLLWLHWNIFILLHMSACKKLLKKYLHNEIVHRINLFIHCNCIFCGEENKQTEFRESIKKSAFNFSTIFK